MSRTRIIMTVVVACGLLTASSEAMAQRPNRSVSRPTLSPYLDMFRNSTGYSDPYRTLSQSYQSPSQRLQRQPITSPSYNGTVNPPRSPEMMRARAQNQNQNQAQSQAVQIAPTGSGSGFMNLGHFYPVTRNSASRARR
ncbi:MAG: hypothetical protein ACYC3X_26905 [Pirellulaceae bacterium]